MQAKSEKRPWNLQIKAQAKQSGFNFKFRLNAAPESLYNLKPHRFSLLLKLRRWRLRVESDAGSPAIKSELIQRNGSLKSRFVRIFQKFRSRLRIKGRSPRADKSAKFAVSKNRLVQCGAFSVVLAIAVVASAFGFDVTKLLECAMNDGLQL